jgi:hypothetical protein
LPAAIELPAVEDVLPSGDELFVLPFYPVETKVPEPVIERPGDERGRSSTTGGARRRWSCHLTHRPMRQCPSRSWSCGGSGSWSRCWVGEGVLGARTGDPEAWAADVQRAVEHATGLVCSVGIGDDRLRAKLTTGFAKPEGMSRVLPAGRRCPEPIGCWPATPPDPPQLPERYPQPCLQTGGGLRRRRRRSTDGHLAGGTRRGSGALVWVSPRLAQPLHPSRRSTCAAAHRVVRPQPMAVHLRSAGRGSRTLPQNVQEMTR